jgi:DNA-directed RNA polymerase subunit B
MDSAFRSLPSVDRVLSDERIKQLEETYPRILLVNLVRQHLDSYNEFIDHGLQEVVDEVGEIPIEVPENPYKVKLGQIWVIDPQSRITGPYVTEVDGTKHEIYPMEARLRNLAYAAPIALEMTPIIDGREQDTELVYIGNIPVMLKSKLCFLSQLSRERNLSQQERIQMNQAAICC